ncbi:EscT/YscT/HrcT family type III secretion system export apparatus protein [Xylophilus sp. Kf1]|nr:EscT/YscT/HrcT family type III secretion system export apparatus protein [Xylophilus sp. Kf1]
MSMAGLFDTAQHLQLWASMLLVFSLRPALVFLVLPATTEPCMTPTIRYLLTMVFAAHVAAGASPDAFVALATPQGLVVLLVREAVIGFTIGFAASQVFWVAQSVGAYVDNLAGYNNVQLINPSSSEQNTPVSDLMLNLVVAVFWAGGGMLVLMGLIGQTYRWWPVLDAAPHWPALPLALAELQMTRLMALVVSLAMPMLFILAFVDVGLGLVSRAAKNVDTTPLGTPLKSACALLSMVLFSTVFIEGIRGYLGLSDLAAMLDAWRSLK